ncbi:hypothetical protein [Flammeovirga kamogawensis]|uniref:Lipoprotein n=1 Tax=Flammeovirga kamogawensis TaxID=373891 RepID=A0ABX8GUH1_9BACT|nr:hypothetical protein [Flammeovirga kamogawensis]MBB6460074.1 hypothetical protein [Flammeovirga kamogawensis]QWG06882.1 hypothetical protein KM029_16465 [Flammeovirga kamogawensis]TRX68704.1 hypothetical protein EO216_11460 [Flammeovirga kamogawensis]
MKITKLFSLFILLGLFSSCAGSYHKIYPTAQNFNSSSNVGNVKLEYKYKVLTSKKYKKKEDKFNTQLVAVKITNNSNHDVILGDNYLLTYQSGTKVLINSKEVTFKSLRQTVPTYLLYLLLAPLQLNTTSSTGQTSSFPIGLIIGPGIAAGNMIGAGSANQNFKTELDQYDILNKPIHPGESKVGLISIQSSSTDALLLRHLEPLAQ